MASTSSDRSEAEDDDFARTRRSIIDRLGDWEDRATWDRFYQTYWKVIHAFARQHGLRNDEAFDVVQETVLAIAHQAQKGQYDAAEGRFKSWLFQQTRWRITDHFRRRGREFSLEDEAPGETPGLERVPDGLDREAVWETEWKANALAVAMERLRSEIAPRQYQIFELSVVKSWPVARVRETLGVSAAQIYLARHRVGALLKKEIERIEKQAL